MSIEAQHLLYELKCTRAGTDFKIEFCWVAGHEGIEGNELADKATKKAADGRSSPAKSLPKFLHEFKGHPPIGISATCQKLLQNVMSK